MDEDIGENGCLFESTRNGRTPECPSGDPIGGQRSGSGHAERGLYILGSRGLSA